jgi:hypothetical protein
LFYKKKKTRGYITENKSESELETNNNDISDTDEEISDEVAAFTKDIQTRKTSCPKWIADTGVSFYITD